MKADSVQGFTLMILLGSKRQGFSSSLPYSLAFANALAFLMPETGSKTVRTSCHVLAHVK